MKRRPCTEAARTIPVSREDMMRYYDPERIQGYCQVCDKYGLFWSCPPFDTPPLDSLPAWSRALLITQKTWVPADIGKDDLIRLFLDARKTLGEFMATQESDGAIAVIAGHCSGCPTCPRARGGACCAPTRLRYSLESLGFDITGLVEGLAGQTLDWPESGPPDYLLVVGALLIP